MLDDRGKQRVEVRAESNDVSISILDREGSARVYLAIDDGDGAPGLTHISVGDGRQFCASLSTVGREPVFELVGSDGKPRLQAAVNASGRPSLLLRDAAGEDRIALRIGDADVKSDEDETGTEFLEQSAVVRV